METRGLQGCMFIYNFYICSSILNDSLLRLLVIIMSIIRTQNHELKRNQVEKLRLNKKSTSQNLKYTVHIYFNMGKYYKGKPHVI